MVFISIHSSRDKELFMSAPVSRASLVTIFICFVIINFAAFYGAYVFDKNSRMKNIISFVVGLIAIGGLVVVLYLNE